MFQWLRNDFKKNLFPLSIVSIAAVILVVIVVFGVWLALFSPHVSAGPNCSKWLSQGDSDLMFANTLAYKVETMAGYATRAQANYTRYDICLRTSN